MSNTIRKLYELAAAKTHTNETCEKTGTFVSVGPGLIAGEYCKDTISSSALLAGEFRSWFAGHLGNFYTLRGIEVSGKKFDVTLYHYNYLLIDDYTLVVGNNFESDSWIDRLYISDFMQSAIDAVATQLEN